MTIAASHAAALITGPMVPRSLAKQTFTIIVELTCTCRNRPQDGQGMLFATPGPVIVAPSM